MSRSKIVIESTEEDIISTMLYIVRWDGYRYVYTPIDQINKLDAELMFSETLELCGYSDDKEYDFSVLEDDEDAEDISLDDLGLVYKSGKFLNFEYTILIGGDNKYWVHIDSDAGNVFRSKVSYLTSTEAESVLRLEMKNLIS